MKELIEPVRTFALAIAVMLYRTFVLQTLWNWFAVPALHLQPVSYWLMYGLILLVYIFTHRDEGSTDQKWGRLFRILGLCVPESQQGSAFAIVQEQEDNSWFQLGKVIAGQFFGDTQGLVFGWVVHTFLA